MSEEPPYEIDLHGCKLDAALRRLELGLQTCRYLRYDRMLVITGRGIGSASGKPVLGPEVRRWLAGPRARALGVLRFEERRKGGALEVEVEVAGTRPPRP